MTVRKTRQYLWLSTGILVALTVSVGAWGWQERKTQTIYALELANRINAYESRLQTKEQVLAEIRLLEGQNPVESLVLAGSTPAIAGANLQGFVKRTIASFGGEFRDSELTRPNAIEPFIEVGVSLQFIATIEALRDILHALENATPAIIMTSIMASQSDEASRELRITLQVKGFANITAS